MPAESETRDRSGDTSTLLRAPDAVAGPPDSGAGRATVHRVLPLAALAVVSGLALWTATGRLLRSEPFRIDSGLSTLRIDGLEVLTEEEVSSVFARDAGQSLAAVDQYERLADLEAMPWVRSARVARVWPNSIAVSIEERQPVAFLRVDGTSAVRMVDSEGVILDFRGAAAQPFPLLTGISADMAIGERRSRIALFERVMEVFRDRGELVGRTVLEVDVSDAGNAVVLARYHDRPIQLQMGNRHLRHRLDVFLSYIEAWRSEFGPLRSVDLRFDKQVTVMPATDEEGSA